MKKLMLIRGLPGSGKTTLAELLTAHNGKHVEADMYFEEETQHGRQYHFDAGALPLAHEWCQNMVALWMFAEESVIVVSNTFTRLKEMRPYVAMAQNHDYQLTVLTVESGLSVEALHARNAHGVPLDTIQRMKERWEPYNAD